MKKMVRKHKFLSLLVLILLSAAMALSVVSCDDNQASEGVKKDIVVEVTYGDGTTKSFEITTDEKTVADALLEEELIKGEEGAYGWYITTIDGEYHKYEDDGKYWAFYINGEYAVTGVSMTDVENGATYAFKVE